MKILRKFLGRRLQIALPGVNWKGWEIVRTHNVIPGRLGNIIYSFLVRACVRVRVCVCARVRA